MNLPSIGVVIPTPGRASLYRTLRSIAYQGLQQGDDILIVGDGFHQATKDLVDAFGSPFRYVATRATHDWGHSQLSWGVKRVKGDVLIYQDDDDIFLPRAFEEIRRLMSEFPAKPLIGRVKTPYRGLLWAKPGLETLLDGHCIVVPNNKEKLGYFTADYLGDQCYISTCLDYYDGMNWADRVWTLTRPTWKMFPRRVDRTSSLWTTYAEMLYYGMEERLPDITTRPLNGPNDWFWLFFSQERENDRPLAAVKLYEDGRRVWATVAYIVTADMQGTIEEIVEFCAWAGQGQNIWFGALTDDEEIIEVLHKKGFEDHAIGSTLSDFVLEWPPKWFPSLPDVELRDADGMHVPDWRDKWGP